MSGLDNLLGGFDFDAMLEALESATLGDFVRFVGNQRELDGQKFREGWLVALGTFLESKAARPGEATFPTREKGN